MTSRDTALEILNTLKLRPSMYCLTREAVLCRATTVLDMLCVPYSASTLYADLCPRRGSAIDVKFLEGEADQAWVNKVVDTCKDLISPE